MTHDWGRARILVLWLSLAGWLWLIATTTSTTGGVHMPQRRPLSALGWPKHYDLQTPPLGGPQDPDPQPGRRVSLRPQPRRAPREEAMALGPLRGVLAGWLRLDATTISAAGGVRVP